EHHIILYMLPPCTATLGSAPYFTLPTVSAQSFRWFQRHHLMSAFNELIHFARNFFHPATNLLLLYWAKECNNILDLSIINNTYVICIDIPPTCFMVKHCAIRKPGCQLCRIQLPA